VAGRVRREPQRRRARRLLRGDESDDMIDGTGSDREGAARPLRYSPEGEGVKMHLCKPASEPGLALFGWGVC